MCCSLKLKMQGTTAYTFLGMCLFTQVADHVGVGVQFNPFVKWEDKVREAEKLVRTLFMVAISRQPATFHGLCGGFLSLEIDSIMSTRFANKNDSSRRLKSEFLVQFDGVTPQILMI
ncbi:hypothetical protein GIB67_039690 [Kingdonia uniflora]|uniref:Uncharacterized protein n=1 Tax=Kingdonia uniflora TaxID=39325 RepID=A0A7J7MPR6_9MAGN|nr:hypothetical protein GIB67_039690 [Kingdonia uniflora]